MSMQYMYACMNVSTYLYMYNYSYMASKFAIAKLVPFKKHVAVVQNL